MERERVTRATRIDSRSRKPKQYGTNRLCTICPTILSVFNRGDRCSVHESPHFHKYRARYKGAA